MTDASSESTTPAKSMDQIMSLCKRRGFVYQASEIYGGINGFWDYGPLGAQLKKNLRDAWWQDVVMAACDGQAGPDGKRISIVPVDTCIIQNPKVWEASGHVGGFSDPMVQCKAEGCKKRFRADHLWLIVLVARKDEAAWYKNKAMAQGNPDAYSALVEKTFSKTFGKIASRSAEEIGTLNERIDAHSLDSPMPHFVEKVMVAGSAEEALESLELTAKERKLDLVPVVEMVGYATPFQNPNSGDVLFHGPCPVCKERDSLGEPKPFNLMFPTVIGATGDWEENKAYLRPETAQGIFINFKNIVDTTRVSVPFGIAQTGKSFRNEVTPRNFTFRSREFEQMEIEFFCHEEDATKWYAFWRDWRMAWWQGIGLGGDNLIMREHDKDELAHYAKDGAGTADIEYRFPFTAPGYGELEGIAHRTDFDLRQHAEHSGLGDKLKYFDTTRGELAKNGQPKGERYFPHVIEPSAGLDRGVLAILCEAYTEDPDRASGVYMKFHPRMAPIKAAVFPLVRKDGMPEKAAELTKTLRKKFGHLGFIETDEKQSIGKRYARMDEAGCPFCFTIDGQTLEDGTVTVRERDTQAQERIAMDAVAAFLGEKLGF